MLYKLLAILSLWCGTALAFLDPESPDYQACIEKSATPLVSVVVASYNRGAWLERAVGSVILQSYPNWELIIVDDASHDPKTIEVLETLGTSSDSRIKVIRLYTNYGLPSYPRNLGILEAKGDFLAIFDDDDIWDLDKLQLQVNFMLRYPEVDVVSSRYYYIDKDDKVTAISVDHGRDTEMLRFQGIFINTIQLQTTLIRFNEKTKPHLIFEHYISEDYFMTYDLLYKAHLKIYNMNDAVHFYRQHDQFRYMSVVKTSLTKLFTVSRGPKEYVKMHKDIYLKEFMMDSSEKS